jgi:hypothetical protein
LADVSEVFAACIIKAIVLMEAASSTETSVNYQTTGCNNREDIFIIAAVRT